MLQRLPRQYLVHVVKVETPAEGWVQRLEVHLDEALAHSPIPAIPGVIRSTPTPTIHSSVGKSSTCNLSHTSRICQQLDTTPPQTTCTHHHKTVALANNYSPTNQPSRDLNHPQPVKASHSAASSKQEERRQPVGRRSKDRKQDKTRLVSPANAKEHQKVEGGEEV